MKNVVERSSYISRRQNPQSGFSSLFVSLHGSGMGDNMFVVIMTILIVTGLIISTVGFLFKSFKPPIDADYETKSKKTLVFFMDKVLDYRIISAPLKFITSNQKAWTNRVAAKILELSEVGFNLQQFYFLKGLCAIICTFCILTVSYSNNVYQKKILIETYQTEKMLLISEVSVDHSKYLLYQQISEYIDIDDLSKYSSTEQYEIVEEAVSRTLDSSDKQLLKYNSQWFLEVYEKVGMLRVYRYDHLLYILLSFFIPEACLILLWLIRGTVYKREIIKLEYIFELLARVDGIKTPDIVCQLENSSKIYSRFLHEFSHLFKYDKVRAFKYLKNRNIKSLSKLANILEIYSLTDREIALQVLEREVIDRDEAIIMTADETVDFIDLVAFLSIVPLVYELARLMLDPMLDMVYKAFEFI